MSEQQTFEAVMEAVAERSEHCERGVLAIDPLARVGFALIGPDCILFSYAAFPVPGGIFDLVLN